MCIVSHISTEVKTVVVAAVVCMYQWLESFVG